MRIAEHGYVRIGTAVPCVQPAAVTENVRSMIRLANEAAAHDCDVILFPEMCITGYTCADLFAQQTLQEAALQGLAAFLKATEELPGVFVVGLPVALAGRLYNGAAVVGRGHVLGVVPKIFLPGCHEYYETRWFASGDSCAAASLTVCGQSAPFGTDLVFRDPADAALALGIEICEDLWAPIPPSGRLALAGASIILNPSASNELVGKCDYRHGLVRQQSARCLAAYAYCSAGVGESTTDMVFSGDCMIAENGIVLAQGERFQRGEHLLTADVDVAFLQHERLSNRTFGRAAEREARSAGEIRWIDTACGGRLAETPLRRTVHPRPFTPSDPTRRHERCREVFAIQSTGLATRLAHAGLEHVVIGLSGGLDSTLALLVCIDAFSSLDLAPSGIHALTMPGFGTTDRTKGNVHALCRALGIELAEISIDPSCRQHFADIGHDGTTEDTAYENVQARERTQILMDKANMIGALVVGTGDLSELALGWCTYNGDHMSMYGVNTGVPKTLVRFLIGYYASDKASPETAAVLLDILDTPISPELLPPDANGEIAQKTESVVGPYELHDFFLYHAIRCGFPPDKVLMLAGQAFGKTYPAETIRQWLRVFYRRFFAQQFKRSCLPDGPKVGTIALSPRGDWRMPSDASAAEWLERL